MLQALRIALRQMRDHSKKCTAVTRFYFADRSSTKTTDTCNQTYIVSAKKAKKRVLLALFDNKFLYDYTTN